MSGFPFARLLWKEYREQRGFWLAMTLLATIAQVAARFGFYHHFASFRCFEIALGAAAFYAAGATATSFAAEHERKTFAFLRALRLSSGQLFAPKLTWAIASALAMQAALWLVAAALNGWRFPPRAGALELLGIWGLAAAEAMAWGVGLSLLTRSPLRAAVLAVVGVTLEIHLAGALSGGQRATSQFYLAAVPLRLFVLSLLVALDVWLAPRWLNETLGLPTSRLGKKSSSRAETDAGGFRLLPDNVRRIGYLVWQSWRMATPWAWLLLAIGLAAIGLTWVEAMFWNSIAREFADKFTYVRRQADWVKIAQIAIGFNVLVATLCGVLAFHADQQRAARQFLAERGASARQVWLSRQIVWIAIATAWTVLVLTMPLTLALTKIEKEMIADWMGQRDLSGASWWAENQARAFDHIFGLWGIFGLLACVPLAYAIGQLASLCISSGLVAATLACCGAAAVTAWSILMRRLEVPWFWSVTPILVALFASSWLRAPAWLLDRRDARSWIRPAAPLVGVAIALAVAVPVYRENEIPVYSFEWPAGSELAKDTPAARETLRQYLAEWERIADATASYDDRRSAPSSASAEDRILDLGPAPPTPNDREYAAECRSVIPLILATSRRGELFIPEPRLAEGVVDSRYKIGDLWRLLVTNGSVLTAEGRFDEAWESFRGALDMGRQGPSPYVGDALLTALTAWAAHPGQSPERIRRALRELRPILRVDPARVARQVRAAYREQAKYFEHPQTTIWWTPPEHWFGKFPSQDFVLAESWLPFELARARRLLDASTCLALDLIESHLGRELAENNVSDVYWSYDDPRSPNPKSAELERWARTTPIYLLPSRLGQIICWEAVAVETDYRATMIVMALEGWKHEHGELPERLEQLEGAYFDRLPLDPRSGARISASTVLAAPLVYFREGLPFELKPLGDGLPPREGRITAGRPLLWSPGVAGQLPRLDGRGKIIGLYGARNAWFQGFSIGKSEMDTRLGWGVRRRDVGRPFVIP